MNMVTLHQRHLRPGNRLTSLNQGRLRLITSSHFRGVSLQHCTRNIFSAPLNHHACDGHFWTQCWTQQQNLPLSLHRPAISIFLPIYCSCRPAWNILRTRWGESTSGPNARKRTIIWFRKGAGYFDSQRTAGATEPRLIRREPAWQILLLIKHPLGVGKIKKNVVNSV